MKSTDIALIVIIVSVSVGLAFVVGNQTIGKTNEQPISVSTITAVSSEVAEPDAKVFREGNINPTVETTITGEDLTSLTDQATQQEVSNNTGDN